MEKRVTSAFGWKFFERISVQGTNFLVTLLLARLLTPSDYGTVSVVTIFIALATTFVQGGFNTALIQKKDVDGNDYLTFLMFSEIVAAALYHQCPCAKSCDRQANSDSRRQQSGHKA